MSSKIAYLTQENFETEALKSELPVLVDFYADWCGPCQMLSPILENLATKYDGKAKICKLNIDEHKKIALQYQVMSIPTLLFIKDGEIKEKAVGALSESDLSSKLDQML